VLPQTTALKSSLNLTLTAIVMEYLMVTSLQEMELQFLHQIKVNDQNLELKIIQCRPVILKTSIKINK
jgi:hypothetical protein